MRLINIKLTNFRKYASAEVDLPDGLTGVLGQNGTGKSTLLEAVGWVLYGHPAARTSKEDIRRQGSSADEVARVELTFELGGAEYTVVREMRGKNLTSDASVITGGQIIARGAHPAQDFIVKLLGMDREAFFVSFFARQKELNALSDYKPAERKTMIIRMLGIDDVDRAIELAKQDGRDGQATLAALQQNLADPITLQASLTAAINDETAVTARLATAQTDVAEVTDRLAAAKVTFEAQEASKASSEVRTRQRELAAQNIDHYRTLATEKQAEWDNLSGKQAGRDAIAPALRYAAEDELKQATSDSATTQTDLAAAEKKADDASGELTAMKNKLARLADRREQDGLAIDRLRRDGTFVDGLGTGGICPTCHQELNDLGRIHEHITAETDAVERRMLDVDSEIAALKTAEAEQAQNLTLAREALAATRVQAATAHEILQRAARLLESLPSSDTRLDTTFLAPGLVVEDRLRYLADRRDEVKRLDVALTRLPEIKTALEELNSKITAALASIKEAEAGSEAAFDSDAYAAARDAYDTAREEKHTRELTVKDLEGAVALAAERVAGLRRELESYEKVAGDIKTLQDSQTGLAALVELFKEFRTYLIGRIRPMLAERAGQLLADLTDGKYTDVELDDDYEIFITDNGRKFPVDRFSGGEKDLANLCLRLAISLTLADRAGSDYGFIVLDEIFGSQDNVRKMNIMRSLAALDKRFRQIFLITHVEDIKEEVENVIEVTETESGLSRLTLV